MTNTYAELKNKERAALLLASSYGQEAEEVQLKNAKQGGIKAWAGYSFESSSGLTPEFAEFSRIMRLHLKKTLAPEFEIISYSRGHFDFSVFAKSKENGKLVYISSSDVRYSPGAWMNNLLVRTAQHDKDYTGGSNDWATLDGLKDKAVHLTR